MPHSWAVWLAGWLGVQEVVAADEQLQAGEGRMLVFARDVATAEATAAALQAGSGSGGGGGAGGVPVLRYHKGVPAGERGEALARLGSQAGLVMVCTDAAARGLDVPDVTHVVQVRVPACACVCVRMCVCACV